MRYSWKDWGMKGHTSPLDENAVASIEEAKPAVVAVVPTSLPLPAYDGVAELEKRLPLAIDTLEQTMLDPSAPHAAKNAAAFVVIERVLGRAAPAGQRTGAQNVQVNIFGNNLPVKDRLRMSSEILQVLAEVEEASQQPDESIEAQYAKSE